MKDSIIRKRDRLIDKRDKIIAAAEAKVAPLQKEIDGYQAMLEIYEETISANRDAAESEAPKGEQLETPTDEHRAEEPVIEEELVHVPAETVQA